MTLTREPFFSVVLRDVNMFTWKTYRACATVIPTRIVQGKLWLWPDSSPEGVEESSKVEPAVVPNLDVVRGPTRLHTYSVAPCLW